MNLFWHCIYFCQTHAFKIGCSKRKIHQIDFQDATEWKIWKLSIQTKMKNVFNLYITVMSVFDLMIQFLLLISKNSILICWNLLSLEDYFEGWIWWKDTTWHLLTSYSYHYFIMNIFLCSMYMYVLCKHIFKIINHSLLYIESSPFSKTQSLE